MDARTDQNPGVPGLPPATDLGPQINSTIWLLTALAASFLALRIYCKFLRHRRLWWDDYFLIGSCIALVADCAFISACIQLGLGLPLTHFDPSNINSFLLLSNLAGSFSILAALWSKTSFAFTVLRISTRWIRALVWFIIVTVNACLGVAIAITWAQCIPIEKVWSPFLEGTCWSKKIQIGYSIFTAVYSGAMDIILALLPWKIIWTLTMNRKEKVGVLVAMSMGIFAGITSIIKITQVPSISDAIFTQATTQLVILGAAESAITIIAASIPILRALIRDRPHASPAPMDFYHPLETVTTANTTANPAMTMPVPIYTGTPGTTGTGRHSAVISSGGRDAATGNHRRGHRKRRESNSISNSSINSNGAFPARASMGTPPPPHHRQMRSSVEGGGGLSSGGSSMTSISSSNMLGSRGRWSGLSRFSGLSVFMVGAGGDRPTSGVGAGTGTGASAGASLGPPVSAPRTPYYKHRRGSLI